MPENPQIVPVANEIHHLALLKKGDCAVVSGMAATAGAEQSATKIRLLELGFAPGEKIRVVAESFPHGDPMAVLRGDASDGLPGSAFGVTVTGAS